MRRVDREALTRALKKVRAQDPQRAQQIDAKLKDEPWEQVARFAAYSCQCDSLRLKPWQSPPCWMTDVKPVDDPHRYGLFAAWELRRKLTASGLSAFEPDPLAALDAIEQAAMAEVPEWKPHQQKDAPP
jgi:hypothetical protein